MYLQNVFGDIYFTRSKKDFVIICYISTKNEKENTAMASDFHRIITLLRKERGITQKQAAAD